MNVEKVLEVLEQYLVVLNEKQRSRSTSYRLMVGHLSYFVYYVCFRTIYLIVPCLGTVVRRVGLLNMSPTVFAKETSAREL